MYVQCTPPRRAHALSVVYVCGDGVVAVLVTVTWSSGIYICGAFWGLHLWQWSSGSTISSSSNNNSTTSTSTTNSQKNKFDTPPQEEQVNAAVSQAAAAMGGIDVLVNNAGGGAEKAASYMQDPASFRKLLDLNVSPTLFVSHSR